MIRFLILVLVLFPFIENRAQMQISESDSLRIDSLVTLSRQLSDSAKYEEAILVRTEALNLQESFYGKENGEYAKSLSGIANYNSSLGNFSEAIRFGTDAMEIRKKLFGAEHSECANSLHNLSFFFYKAGNISEAIFLVKEAMRIRKKVLGIEHPDYLKSLNNLTFYYNENGNYSDAICCGKELAELRKKTYGTEHPVYITSLKNIANYYYELENFTEAIRICSEAVDIQKRISGPQSPDYAMLLSDLALYKSGAHNYKEAICLSTEAMEIYKNIYGIYHIDYILSLGDLATYNHYVRNDTESVRLCTEEIELYKTIFGSEDSDYASLLNSLAIYKSYIGNVVESISLCLEASIIFKKLYGLKNPSYATCIFNLADYHHKVGNNTEAIRLYTEAMEIQKEVLGVNSPDYALSLCGLSTCYESNGNYSDAIRFCTEAIEIQKKLIGAEHPDYANSLNNLANYYSDIGDYFEAIRIGTEAMEIRKRAYGQTHPDYIASLNNIAIYNAHLGNYTEAERIGLKVLNIREKSLGEEHIDYVISLLNLAEINSCMGKFSDAIRLCTKSTNILETTNGVNNPIYALCMNNLANYNDAVGKIDEAVRFCTKSLEIRKKLLGHYHPDYAMSLCNLANYKSESGNYSEAFRLGSEAMEIYKKTLGPEHPNYALSLSNIAEYNKALGNYSEAANLMSQSTDITENHVLKMFSGVSSYMRNQYWDKNKYGIINTFPLYVYRSNTHIGDLYDKSALFAKGLLLNADTELGKLIAESGDTLALKKLEELRTTRSILSKLYEKPVSERFLDTDSLEQLERRQEADLMRMSKVYGDFTRNLRMTWRDVQKGMKAGEVAIEFLSFPLNEDSTMYIALTLKPGYDCPKMTTLCEEKQLTSVPRDDIYTTPSMYQALWRPLEDELKDVKTVYFSPSGALYNIGIEYLPTEDGTGIYEHYDLYRLSSTRQIALKHDKKKDGTAVLYGGIKYDADTESLESENSQYTIVRGNDWNSTFVGSTRALDDSSLRGGCGYLPGTKVEVDNISSTLTDNGVTNKAYTDIRGTEESFKALGGTRPDILHIATHGFYWTESDAEKVARMHNAMRFLQMDNGDRATVEDKALTRSGLMMAGSNRTINGERLPDGVDDGILTAKEISQVDLRGCDLVVLSACQTALGDVSGSEGVFGLQRAFKKSGVQTLLMSMWKVDDTATQIMMTEFYQNLASGMGKRRAFLEAQQSLHDIDDDPSHWAAFVMLDAIE